MASMRKLRRRLLRWDRYAARLGRPSPALMRLSWDAPLRGHARAYDAVEAETERRFWDEAPEVWLGGPSGEAALIADVLGCDVCKLPDPYNGDGDGIGSCDCARCDCGEARGSSLCACPSDDEADWGDLQETYPGSGIYE